MSSSGFENKQDVQRLKIRSFGLTFFMFHKRNWVQEYIVPKGQNGKNSKSYNRKIQFLFLHNGNVAFRRIHKLLR